MFTDNIPKCLAVIEGAPLLVNQFELSSEKIIAFASEFDPQPFHINEQAAKTTLLRGLCASGWHTCTMQHQIFIEFLAQNQIFGRCDSCEEIRWAMPVRPGVKYSLSLLSAHTSHGGCEIALSLTDEDGAEAMFTRNTWRLGKHPLGRIDAPLCLIETPQLNSGLAFEDIHVGALQNLGAFKFADQEITAFNQTYTPSNSNTSVSQWQLTGGWMRRMLKTREMQCIEALRLGKFVPQFGPATGLKGLNWRGDVSPGETIQFYSTVTAKRPTSEPGWGLITVFNQGINALHQEVMNFNATIFIGTRT